MMFDDGFVAASLLFVPFVLEVSRRNLGLKQDTKILHLVSYGNLICCCGDYSEDTSYE
jgi:hypothetical protein